MQAIIQESFNGISDLKIREIPDPKLSPLSVLVRTKYTPVLPYDWRTEFGELQQIRPVKLPLVIGYGFAGIVQRVGSLRNGKLVGKKVIGASMSGSSSTMIDSRMPPLLFPVPENVELRDAATIIGGADAALGIINKAHIKPGDVILITGASGGIGTYLIQLLKQMGTKIIVLGHSSNVEFLERLGTDIVIDYTDNIFKQFQKVDNVTKVIDTAGNIQILKIISDIFSSSPIISVAINHFNSNQFNFIHPNIYPSDYQKLLGMISTGELHSYIQEIFDYKDVVQAQNISRNAHSKGRILLKY